MFFVFFYSRYSGHNLLRTDRQITIVRLPLGGALINSFCKIGQPTTGKLEKSGDLTDILPINRPDSPQIGLVRYLCISYFGNLLCSDDKI